MLEYENFRGIIVVDEAYIDFSGTEGSAVKLVEEYSNIVVMQTLSKGFGLAAIRYVPRACSGLELNLLGNRLGFAIAQPPIIRVLSCTKAPYNVSAPTAHLALAALSPPALTAMREKVNTLVASRSKLRTALSTLAPLGVGPVIGANDANFLVVPILSKDGKPDNVRSQKVYRIMAEENKVVVRFRGEPGCEGCLRITIGSEEENIVVIQKLGELLQVL